MENGVCSYRRFLEGDEDALTEIVREYRDGLYYFLLGITGQREEAEDLMEDTFFRLIVKKPKFREESDFKTWLYSIARHLALDRLRRRRFTADQPPEEELPAAAEAEPERLYLAEDRRQRLRRAMEKLNADYAQVLWLVYFEDFTPAQTAAVMKKTSRQMKNLLYRAKEALRIELAKEGFENEKL